MPCATWRAISMSVLSLNFVSFTWMCLYKLEPSHHCVTMARDGLLTQPMKRRMLQWRVFFSIATSFLNACNWAGLGVLTFNVFTATGPCQWALYTVPKEPEPILGPIRISSAWIFYKKKTFKTKIQPNSSQNLPNFHHFALYPSATEDFCYFHLRSGLAVVSHVLMCLWARLALNGSVPDLIESEKYTEFLIFCQVFFQRFRQNFVTWNGLMLCRILLSVAVGALKTLLMQTFGAEFDRSWELSDLGCLKLDYFRPPPNKSAKTYRSTLAPELSGFASNSW